MRFYDLNWVMLKLKIIAPEIFDDLDGIRKKGNNYIHSKLSLNPKLDSEEVINALGRLVDRTSNIFNKHDIIQGKLVPKAKSK